MKSYAVMVGRDVTERKHNHEMLAALLSEKGHARQCISGYCDGSGTHHNFV